MKVLAFQSLGLIGFSQVVSKLILNFAYFVVVSLAFLLPLLYVFHHIFISFLLGEVFVQY